MNIFLSSFTGPFEVCIYVLEEISVKPWLLRFSAFSTRSTPFFHILAKSILYPFNLKKKLVEYRWPKCLWWWANRRLSLDGISSKFDRGNRAVPRWASTKDWTWCCSKPAIISQLQENGKLQCPPPCNKGYDTILQPIFQFSPLYTLFNFCISRNKLHI